MSHAETTKKWWILLAMICCISMIFINQTALTVALPSIQEDLHISQSMTQWVVNIYLMALTLSLIGGGRLGDILGLRKTFLIGASIFSFASIGGALSQSVEWLLGIRALQGIGGAMLWPASTAILFSSFPVNERGKAIGIYVSMGTVGLTLGPFLGGFFSEHLNWTFIFWFNLPFIILAMALTSWFVPASNPKNETFDLRGFISFGIGISCLLFAMLQGQEWGWSSPYVILLFVLGIAFLILMHRMSSKEKYPLVDFSLFRNRIFIGANLAVFLTQFVVMTPLYWTLYFQDFLEFTPTVAGAVGLLSGLPVIFIAPFAGRLSDRYGPSIPIALGFGLIVLALLWMLLVCTYLDCMFLLPGIFVFGCGSPFIFTPSAVAGLNQVTAEKRGVVSSIMMTLRQLGSTMGVAVIGTLFSIFHKTHFEGLMQNDHETKNLHSGLFDAILNETGEALQMMDHLSEEMTDRVIENFDMAYHQAFTMINALAFCLAVFGLVFVRLLLNRPKSHTTNNNNRGLL